MSDNGIGRCLDAATGMQHNPPMIDPARIRVLRDAPAIPGRYVLYWMQASQRTVFNPALEYAAEQANAARLPLIVGFGLMDDYPEANARHYAFMLEGLRDVEGALRERGIRFVARRGSPPEVALALAREASLVVCDRGYLRHQKRWRDALADGAGRRVVQVEGDVVVPIEEVSSKQEFAARTLRPKINKLLSRFLKPLKPVALERESIGLRIAGDIDVSDPLAALGRLKVDRNVPPTALLAGGQSAAGRMLREFVRDRLPRYRTGRREPSVLGTSLLAAYLHFGQVSPVAIALAVRKSAAPLADQDAFLEELIVRRELSMNFVHFQPQYDDFEGLPNWARKTLMAHAKDARAGVYSRQELEEAKTHDPYWNAAQTQMLRTGYMHNMMRMYWGKKILEWKRTPREAFDDALYLNNKYFLCGRDPVSYANIGWLFGLHDRPWGERPVFGMVRYMNAAGLDRKFDMPAYLRKVAEIQSNQTASPTPQPRR